ncbi:DUF7266 family protein [Halomicrobium salinisoli]|uniref:DUF7266 family protein n=1 Tax=Halomicrobium salinisoli TaxID=2878391 RepID=UPI001CF0CA2C|nr:hypothetical protein [Halomicrobium salinisoli]
MTDRAVSSALNYTLTLAISTLLVTGLLIAGIDFVEARQDQVLRTELSVIGEQVAADLDRASRLAAAGTGTTEVWVNQSFPERVAGTRYWVRLDPGPPSEPPRVVVESTDPVVTAAVRLKRTVTVAESRTDGGDVAVVYDDSADELEVTDG